MYESFYNLAASPFENTPDPAFFFESDQHREALAAIEYGVRIGKGLVVISGDLGAGKTTVIRTMLARCGDTAQVLSLCHGIADRCELQRHLLRSLGKPADRGADHAELTEQITATLRQRLQTDYPLVLLIDEAQSLSDEVLDELRHLTNLNDGPRSLLQIVLVGQNELVPRLAAPHLAALRQRISMARHLAAFDPKTTNAYIQHRLRIASQNPDRPAVSFRGDAVVSVYRYSLGLPRLINTACDHALLLGMVREQRVITATTVDAVVAELLPQVEPQMSGDGPLARIMPQPASRTVMPLARSA